MKRCMRFLTIILAISLCTNIAFASNVFSSTTGTNEEGAPLTEAAKKVVSEIEDLTDKINRGDFDENETVKGEIDNVRDHLNKLTSEERTHPEIVKAKADLDAVDPSIVITAGEMGKLMEPQQELQGASEVTVILAIRKTEMATVLTPLPLDLPEIQVLQDLEALALMV